MRKRFVLMALFALSLGACKPAPPATDAPHFRLGTVTTGLSATSGVDLGPDGIYLSAPEGLSLLGPEGQLHPLNPAAARALKAPAGLALAAGSVFVADPPTNRIWRIAGEGAPEPFAGTGTSLFPIGDGGLAISAQLNAPGDVAIGPGGNLYLADRGNHRIRKVDPNGRITTVAGNGMTKPFAVGPATRTSLFYPEALDVGPDGSLYIADTGHHAVRRVSPDGQLTTLAGTGTEGFKGDGGLAKESQLASPSGLVVLPSGDLLVSDTGNHRVRWIHPDGAIQTIAGNGRVGQTDEAAEATSAKLDRPGAIALGPDGTPFFVDRGARRLYQLQKTKNASGSLD